MSEKHSENRRENSNKAKPQMKIKNIFKFAILRNSLFLRHFSLYLHAHLKWLNYQMHRGTLDLLHHDHCVQINPQVFHFTAPDGASSNSWITIQSNPILPNKWTCIKCELTARHGTRWTKIWQNATQKSGLQKELLRPLNSAFSHAVYNVYMKGHYCLIKL